MQTTDTVNTNIRLKQGDAGIEFFFKIMLGDNAQWSDSEDVHLVFKRPDGSSVVGKATRVNERYRYVLKGNELEVPGIVLCDLKFNIWETRESTSTISFECVPDTLTSDSADSSVYVNDIVEIMGEINRASFSIRERYNTIMTVSEDILDRYNDIVLRHANVYENTEKVTECTEVVEANTEKVETLVESLPESFDDVLNELSSVKNTSQIIPTASGSVVTVTDSSDNAPVSISLYGKCEQGENPTPEAPQEVTVAGADGDITVTSCGKNSLNNTVETFSSHGITFTKNEDDSVSYSGVSSDGAHAWYYGMGGNGITYDSGVLFKAGTYIYSVGNSAINVLVRIINEDNTYQNIASGSQSCFTLEEDCRIWAACALSGVAQGQSYSGTFYPMIRMASITDDTYEPYTAITGTIPLTNELAGIPVSSGGNYTDEKGQQWVADTIERYADGTGKGIQRIKKLVITGNESFKVGSSGAVFIEVSDVAKSKLIGMCTHSAVNSTSDTRVDLPTSGDAYVRFFGYFDTAEEFATFAQTEYANGNPITIYYPLAEPIETALTSEQITELKKLKTFKPVTNVFTDDIADVGIEYVADIKLYIDNKFNELETAILSAVGSEV